MVDENGANYCVIQKVLALILSHQMWPIVRCTMRMVSIGWLSELVQVTEIFSKALVMECAPLQL